MPAVPRNHLDVIGRDHETRLHAEQVEADFGVALEVERHRSLDDGGAEAAPRRRLHRRTAAFLPVDHQARALIEPPAHLDLSGRIGQRAVFRRVGHHLVDDERQRREGLGIERDIGPAHPDPPGARAEIGAGLGLHQRFQRHRRPVQAGDLVMRTGQRLNAPAQHSGEFLGARGGVLALRHEPAHEAQDVANAMIELGDHQFLALLRRVALSGGEIGELQDHFEQRDPQPFGDVQVGASMARIGRGRSPATAQNSCAGSIAGRAGPRHRPCSDRRPT